MWFLTLVYITHRLLWAHTLFVLRASVGMKDDKTNGTNGTNKTDRTEETDRLRKLIGLIYAT